MIEVTTLKQLKDETKEGTVLLYFSASWCGHCVGLKQTLNRTIPSYGNKVKLIKVDVDNDEEIAPNYGIMSIPTLFLFENGTLTKQHVGGLSESDLKVFIG